VSASRATFPLAALLVWLAAIGACAVRGGSEPAARLLAVHNVMRSTGRGSLGPVGQGSLAEGQQARLALPIRTGCATIVAFGGPGTRDIGLTLLGPDGKVVARETAVDPQAVLTACPDQPGDHTVVVKMESGSGEYVVASFAGAEEPKAPATSAAQESGGTCDAPAGLSPGQTISGTTLDAPNDYEGSCGNTMGPERIYRMDIASRQRVSIEVEARFDSVLYLRKDDCSDDEAEIACNDDVPGGANQSKINAVLDPGSYYVFVDGYGDAGGGYRLRVSAQAAPTVREICAAARPLVAGATVVGNYVDAFDNAHATCGGEARGADVVYRMDLATRSRVRLTERSGQFQPVVHVRRTCEDEKSEVGCSSDGADDGEAVWTGVLDSGTYWVYADSAGDDTSGTFTLTQETAPAAGAVAGAGPKGDGCGDAVSLSSGSSLVAAGDTFAARDDVAVSCGSVGAADVVYRIDAAHRSRVTARTSSDNGIHVLALTRACGDRSAEIICARSVDRVIEPGTTFLVVDAKSPESMGRFKLSYRIDDLALAEAACSHATALAIGRTVRSTTAGAGNKLTSCASSPIAQAAPDRVFRFKLDRRTTVTALLEKGDAHGVLSIRKACADGSAAIRCVSADSNTASVQTNADLGPGTYYVVVEVAQGDTKGGPFSLRVDAKGAAGARPRAARTR
jgi:hypothetical protein